MTITDIFKRAQKLAIDNSPQLLTAVGVVGTVTTAVLTGKAAVKADRILRHDEETYESLRTTRETVELVWKEFIPPVTVGMLTVSAIIGANQIGTRRAAAIASAYAISEKAFTEYKTKVIETIGKKQEQTVRDEIAQDRVRNNPPSESTLYIANGGDSIFMDAHTGRYFKSDMETVKKAMNDTNYMVLNNYYASLNDFYDKIGLDRIPHGDDIGWNSDKLMDISFSTTMTDDCRPCIVISFRSDPIRGYSRIS